MVVFSEPDLAELLDASCNVPAAFFSGGTVQATTGTVPCP